MKTLLMGGVAFACGLHCTRPPEARPLAPAVIERPHEAPVVPPFAKRTVHDGIVQVGPYEYVIDAGFFEKANDRQEDLTRGVAFIPDVDAGDDAGVHIRVFDPAPFATAVGLRDHDRLLTLNGAPLGSPQRLVAVYPALQNAKLVVLVLERDGALLHLRYRYE